MSSHIVIDARRIRDFGIGTYIRSLVHALGSIDHRNRYTLVSGPAGLDALSAIIQAAPRHLESGGWLVLEHGSTQHGDVASMLERRGFGGIETHEDFSARPRVTLGNLKSPH